MEALAGEAVCQEVMTAEMRVKQEGVEFDKFSQVDINLDLSNMSNTQEKGFESQHVNNLLYSSFVQLDQFVERQVANTTFNLDTGNSFYKRSNNLFHSEIKKVNKNTMKHKKVQCEIGTTMSLSQNEGSGISYYGKCRQLQILKMIKLFRIIFKQLRQQKQKIREEVKRNVIDNTQTIERCQKYWNQNMGKIDRLLKEKDEQIFSLHFEIERLLDQNQKLRHRIEIQTMQNSKIVKQFQEQKWRSQSQINQMQNYNQNKIKDLNQKIQQLQSTCIRLTQEVVNLNDTVCNNQNDFKKMEYQNGQLNNQNKELTSRLQILLKKFADSELSFNQECLNLETSNEQTFQLLRLNELYLKQIESCKLEIKEKQVEIDALRRESQNYIAQELNRYQQCFSEEYTKAKKQYNRELFNKNSIIQNYMSKEKVYLAIIGEKNKQMRDKVPINKLIKQNNCVHCNCEKIPSMTFSSISKFNLSLKQNSNSNGTIGANEQVSARPLEDVKVTFEKGILKTKQNKSNSSIKVIQKEGKCDHKPISSKYGEIETVFRAKNYDKDQLKISELISMAENQKTFSSSDGLLNRDLRSKLFKWTKNLDDRLVKKLQQMKR